MCTIKEELPSIGRLRDMIYSISCMVHSLPFEEAENKGITFWPSELVVNAVARSQPVILRIETLGRGVHRVLIDRGATRDVMFYDCFKSLSLGDSNMTSGGVRLEAFNG